MQKGDFVRIDYVGKVKDTNEIFDLTNEEIAKKENVFIKGRKYKPIPIIVGEGFVLKGLDEQIMKMNVGERKTVTINPENGFGERKAELIKVLPMSFFKKQKVTPAPGLVINVSGMRGRIQSVNSGRVRIDFNNPLAGKTLEYDIEIKEKIDDPKNKIESLFEFFGIDIKAEIKDGVAEIESEKSKITPELKEKTFSLITKYLKIERVRFIEVFDKTKTPNK